MKNLCFYFQVHQPFRLRRFHFFNIGEDNNYFDVEANSGIMRKVAEKCYLPTNELLYHLIRKYPRQFKVSFSISGTALDQFEQYAPEVLLSFRKLASTGAVEFLAETHAHSLSALKSKEEFKNQVKKHVNRINELFGLCPMVLRNTELIFNDHIAGMANEMGFMGVLTEGAPQVLGWRSSNYLYSSASHPQIKLLLKNYRLSDDVAFRFSDQQWKDWPLTTEKYLNWLAGIAPEEQIINLFMDYETFGEHQWATTGIFEFLKVLPERVLAHSNFEFVTPSEAIKKLQPIAPLSVPYSISWADEQRDLTAWLGNELQNNAFDKLYDLEHKVKKCEDSFLFKTWEYLQTSDHFYYMCTKYFSDGDVHKYFNPYQSPYEAFINYMNVLSDFELRVNEQLKTKKVVTANQTRRKKVFSKHNVEQPELVEI